MSGGLSSLCFLLEERTNQAEALQEGFVFKLLGEEEAGAREPGNEHEDRSLAWPPPCLRSPEEGAISRGNGGLRGVQDGRRFHGWRKCPRHRLDCCTRVEALEALRGGGVGWLRDCTHPPIALEGN